MSQAVRGGDSDTLGHSFVRVCGAKAGTDCSYEDGEFCVPFAPVCTSVCVCVC